MVHWYNSEIRHTINCLRTARKMPPTPNSLSKIQSLESHLSSLIISAKSNFEHKLSTQSTSKIFRYIRSFLPSSSVPPIISLDSCTGSSDYERATLFNTFFHSVFTQSSFLIPPLESLPTPTTTLSDIGISEMDVYEALSSLDTTKAEGHDHIGPKILKHCASALFEPLHHLFLLCLSQHELPSEWREHMIVPIFKSGDASLVKNYRPISLLCTTSKILEKLIYDKVISYISSSISSCQFGFRPRHSTTQQLLLFLNKIHDSLTAHSQTDVIYLDFKKAFDSVSHNELLVKLWSFGITGNLWKWFQSYLSCRSQRVILNHCLSDPLPVLSGVPQGSILGPLLFLIFVNDLTDPVKHSNMFLYADDTKCFRKVSSVADCVLLQEDLCQLSSWSQKWNLHFNGHKCVLVRFHSNLSCIPYNYKISNVPIQALTTHRDLGIVMSADMSWSAQLKQITARAYKTLGLIRRCFSTALCTSAKKNLYLSLVRSQLSYGSQIWRPHLIKDILELEHIQRRATKYILDDFHSSYKCRLQSLKILPLMMQLELYDILFFIRCLKEPDEFNAFSIKSYINFSNSNTRSTTHLKLKHSLSKSFSAGHFYFNRLPRLWNSLPPLDLDQSLQSLKKYLWTFLWSQFELKFKSDIPCSFHLSCPCPKCVQSSFSVNYTLPMGTSAS